MGKKVFWVIAIMVVFFIATFSVYWFWSNKKLHEENVRMYNYLACQTNCPTEQRDNGTFFNPTCIFACHDLVQNTDFNADKTPDNKKYLINSDEVHSCINQYATSHNQEVLRSCFQQILPTLKEKYSIE